MSTLRSCIVDELILALPNRNYTSLLIDDLVDLCRKGVAPKVVLREIEALEGTAGVTFELEPYLDSNSQRVPIHIVSIPSADEEDEGEVEDVVLEMSMSGSATKAATMFYRKDSPIYGLYHKHYSYLENKDMVDRNLSYPPRQLRDYSMPQLMTMMLKIATSTVTGEWIIFKDDGVEKTYLCLWEHKKGDKELAERLISHGVSWNRKLR